MSNEEAGNVMKTGHRSTGDAGEHLENAILQDFADGVLDEAGMHQVEAHLEQCLQCRASVEWIRQLRKAARELPSTIDPPPTQWKAIRGRIRAESQLSSQGEGVVRSITSMPRSHPGDRRVHLPPPRRSNGWMLAAAAIALVALSSATTLWVVTGAGLDPAGGVAVGPATPSVPGAGSMVGASRALGEMESGYGPAVQELEWVLEEAGDVLAPETLQALEESLAAIDLAIAEAREAILADPGAVGLVEVLNGHYEWKVQLLRQMAELVQAT